MCKREVILVIVALLAIAGCKKADPAAIWDGTYISSTGGAYASTFNQLVIQTTGDNTVRIYADTVLPTGVFYTYTEIQKCNVESTTSATFSESDTVLGYSNPLLLTGTATLNNGIIIFQGTGINTYDTIAYYFYGTKQ